jgi:hypothetical protein
MGWGLLLGTHLGWAGEVSLPCSRLGTATGQAGPAPPPQPPLSTVKAAVRGRPRCTRPPSCALSHRDAFSGSRSLDALGAQVHRRAAHRRRSVLSAACKQPLGRAAPLLPIGVALCGPFPSRRSESRPPTSSCVLQQRLLARSPELHHLGVKALRTSVCVPLPLLLPSGSCRDASSSPRCSLPQAAARPRRDARCQPRTPVSHGQPRARARTAPPTPTPLNPTPLSLAPFSPQNCLSCAPATPGCTSRCSASWRRLSP